MKEFAAMTDEDLMEAYYLRGEEGRAHQAFAELDRRYRAQMILSLTVPGYNRRSLKLPAMPGRQQKAEELVTLALFKAADTRGRPSAQWDRGRKPVHSWLFGILHNVVASHLRRAIPSVRADTDCSRHDGPEAPPDLEGHSAPGPEPAEAAQHRAVLAALRACLDELPEEPRHVCELLFGRGMKQTEVADLLNVSAPTLTRRKQEACGLLRRCLRWRGVNLDVLAGER
jgi:RNA polymerase sigma factor (sigma-70 family)